MTNKQAYAGLLERLLDRAKCNEEAFRNDNVDEAFVAMTWGLDREAAEAISSLLNARDEAQSAVQAWVHVAEGLGAHIMDRAAMNDPASPETYLSILRGDVADVAKRSEQICAARWADYKRHSDANDALLKRVGELEGHWEALDRIIGETFVENDKPDRVRWEGEWHEGPAATAHCQVMRSLKKLCRAALNSDAPLSIGEEQ